MQIREESIKEYMELYREDFGEELTIEEAREITSRLVELYRVLCRPLREEVEPPQAYHDHPRIG